MQRAEFLLGSCALVVVMQHLVGKTHSELTLEHLDCRSLIGKDLINPGFILKALECCGQLSRLMLRSMEREEGGHQTEFLKYIQVQCFPALYDRATEHSGPTSIFHIINRKVKIFAYMLPVRNASHGTDFVGYDCNTDEVLLCASAIGVNFDLQTRRPTPFHPRLKAYLSPENCTKVPELEGKLPLQGTTLQKIPSGVKKYSTIATVMLTQIDYNNHLNNASYIEFALNCIGEAFSKNAFDNFSSVFNHRIHRFSLLYQNEARLGDRIVTTTWQDANPQIFKFHLNRDADLLSQVEIEFFPTDELLKSNL